MQTIHEIVTMKNNRLILDLPMEFSKKTLDVFIRTVKVPTPQNKISKNLFSLAGALKKSKAFGKKDPVKIQRDLRDEWK